MKKQIRKTPPRRSSTILYVGTKRQWKTSIIVRRREANITIRIPTAVLYMRLWIIFEDRARGTITDVYYAKGLRDILAEIWRLSHSTKSSVVAANLRGLLDFILSHLLARGETRHFAELPDLQLLMLENESLSPCPALLYIMSSGNAVG